MFKKLLVFLLSSIDYVFFPLFRFEQGYFFSRILAKICYNLTGFLRNHKGQKRLLSKFLASYQQIKILLIINQLETKKA